MLWTVTEGEITLKNFIFKQLKGELSLNAVKKELDRGLCTVNGKLERYATRLLINGDRVSFLKKSHKAETLFTPELTIYEDEFLLIWNKPRDLVCNSKAFLKSTPSLLLVHRLDKETTGALIFAKSEEVRAKMEELFNQKKVHKRYLAEVWGLVKKDQDHIITPYGVIYKEGTCSRYGVKGDKKAETKFEVIARKKGVTELYLYPITGRTHQLRVHMASIGHPICGDIIYGRRPEDSRYPLKLHSQMISFTHPITNEPIEVYAKCH